MVLGEDGLALVGLIGVQQLDFFQLQYFNVFIAVECSSIFTLVFNSDLYVYCVYPLLG